MSSERSQQGIALITTLLVMLLMSSLMVGFTAVVMSDQRFRGIDRDRSQAFYAAHSGLEKLTVDLGNLFFVNIAPTQEDLDAAIADPPEIPGIQFESANGTTGYTLTAGTPSATTIQSGPYQGLIALKTAYELNSTARTRTGGEVHLTRSLETVAIPVFQFGLFSDPDLSFHAGPNFNFGGRVHSNGNLFLAQNTGATLTLPERVTAVGEIIRQRLVNGQSIDTTGHVGTISVTRGGGAFRNLERTEGSVVDTPGGAVNEPLWTSLSLSTYNGNIRNGRTGAKALNLPLITVGGSNADLVRRPASADENTAAPTLFGQRYFSQVSLRVLLSDLPADIANLPTVTATAPVLLAENWTASPPNNGTAYGPISGTRPPIARSPGRVLVGGNLPVVSAAVTAGNNATLNLNTTPFGFQVQTSSSTAYALAVTKNNASPPVTHYVTCTGKTSTSFTGCGTPWPTPSSSFTTSSTGTTIRALMTTNGGTVVSTSLSSTYGTASWTTLNVSSTAAFTSMTAPTLTVTKGANTYTVQCALVTTESGHTHFTGCRPQTTPASAVNTPATVSATIPTFDGTNKTVSAAMSANWASPWNRISVTPWDNAATPGNGLSFALNTFWVQNGDNTDVLVTCRGYTFWPTSQLTGCNVPADLQANATLTSGALTDSGIGTVGGYIKIEMQDTDNVWHDVTMEILNYGIATTNLAGKSCGTPAPNAIIILQRLRDNSESGNGTCSYASSVTSTDYWPNTLFDSREGLQRDAAPSPSTSLILGGLMHYVAVDVGNLMQWFASSGAYAAGSGSDALPDNTGYSLYFSDRRNNRNASNQETGEYGFEDVVNGSSSTGTPNGGTPEAGEDVNGDGTLQTYGQLPSYQGTANSVPPPGTLSPYTTATARPTVLIRQAQAKVNRAVLFRRALKLVNGSRTAFNNAGIGGFTVASENPVYVQGDWNLDAASLTNPGLTHAATSIVADAVTLLSNNWSDNLSFTSPYTPTSRLRPDQSYYRFAVIAGKNVPFPRPTVGTTRSDFGTDGGAHNFLRMLESGGTVNYRGSIATFYYSRQAVGVYKVDVIYGAPTRNFNFDVDFLNPSLLPPLTPVFRDLNTLGFSQELRPGF